MLLMLAFICFFAMFAAWLIVPNVHEKSIVTSTPASTQTGAATLQVQA